MHYVIVGNGVAGANAALTIRKHLGPDQARITLVSDESPYFFSRTALMYAYMNDLSRRDLEPYERPVWDRQHIERLQARIVDLDAEAGELRCKDGTRLSYDRCLLAVGARPRRLDVPGIDEPDEGVVHFVTLQDLDECERLTWSTDRAVVVGGGLIGVELAECFAHHDLDVTFLVREPYYWPAAFSRPEGQMITDHIRAHGIDLRHETELQAVNTGDDGRVSGVVTDGGDHIDCQMLGIAVGVTPNVGWLAEATTPPRIERGIRADSALRTSLPNVWAAGDCAQVETVDGETHHEPIWYTARDHGRLAGRSMVGIDVEYDPPMFYNSAKFFEIEYTTVGDFRDLPDETPSLFRWLPDGEISQRIAYDPDDERVLAFSMLGSRWDHRVLMDWIAEGRTLPWVRENLEDAQFDVEFGQTNLDEMNEEVRML